jgi:hypothetical protein
MSVWELSDVLLLRVSFAAACPTRRPLVASASLPNCATQYMLTERNAVNRLPT